MKFVYTFYKEGREELHMAQKVGIGYQSFREVREENIFYIDKTLFIKEWWEYVDKVTLITRPRRACWSAFSRINMRAGATCLRGLRYGTRNLRQEITNTGSFRGDIL